MVLSLASMLCGGLAHAQPRALERPLEAVTRVDGIERAIEYSVTIEGDGTYGAGVLIDPARGLVLTNQHVTESMHAPRITFSDGVQVQGRVIDSDPKLDLSLIEVPPQKRPGPLSVGLDRLRPGEELYAVGNPRHLGFTVSRGIVSYVGREMEGQRYVQTDLPINEGNSGGPMVNARGELLGIMSFVMKRAQGLSFALPIHYAYERFASRLAPTAKPSVSLTPPARR